MNLFEKVTRPYATASGPVVCLHPDVIRTVRTDSGRPVWIARCPACPALTGSLVGPPYVAPWYLGRPG
jgi:hypothetical protein